MVSHTLKGLVIVAAGAALTLPLTASAQTSQRRPPISDESAIVNRPSTIKQLGLADQSIGLTSTQQVEIDKIVDTYVAERKALDRKYPVTPGKPSSPEAAKARRDVQTKLSAGLARILTAEQKKALQARKEAEVAQRFPAGQLRSTH